MKPAGGATRQPISGQRMMGLPVAELGYALAEHLFEA
jgi:hypothetical protein